jgi:hypothetical protein
MGMSSIHVIVQLLLLVVMKVLLVLLRLGLMLMLMLLLLLLLAVHGGHSTKVRVRLGHQSSCGGSRRDGKAT